MPEVRATLELDSSDALSTVDTLGTAISSSLDEAVSNFSASFDAAISGLAPVVIEPDVSAVTPDIEAAVTSADALVPVEADASAVGPEIDAAISSTEGVVPVDADASSIPAEIEAAVTGFDPPPIEIDADTSGAVAALDELSGAAESTGESLGGTEGAAAGFGAAADLSTGSAAGLGTAIGGLSKGAGAAAGAVTAGAVAVGVMFNEAVNAQGAVFRLNSVMGDLASKINTLQVGNLNADLSELAIQLGSDDDAMRNAATSTFLFATNAGVARGRAADFSSEVLALAARGVALNPALGDAGAASDRLMKALITGRDRALVPFNLGLDKSVVAAKAQELALAAGRTEVLGIDKAMAGAALATEKFGGHLKQDIGEGIKNPILQLRAFKTQLSETLEAIGKPLVAPIFDLLKALLPVAESAGRIIGSLATAVLPIFAAAAKVLGPILGAVADGLSLIESVAPGATVAIAGLIASMTFGNPLFAVAGLLVGIGQALGVFGGEAETASDRITRLGAASDAALAKIVQNEAAARAAADAQGVLSAELAKSVPAFAGGGNAAEAHGEKISKSKVLLDDLRGVAEENIGTAKRLGQAYVDAGLITEAQYNRVIGDANTKQAQAKVSADGLTGAIGQEATAYNLAKTAVAEYTAELEASNAGRTDAFNAETQLASALQGSFVAFTAAKGSIDANTEAGRANRDALSQVATQAFASSAAIKLTGGSAAEVQAPIDTLRQRIVDMAAAFGIDPAPILNALGLIPVGAKAAGDGITAADIPGKSNLAVQAATTNLLAGFPFFTAAGRGLGTSLDQGLVSTTPAVAASAGRAAVEAAAEGTRRTGLMADAGRALGTGFAHGLDDRRGAAAAAGRGLAGDDGAAGGTRGTGAMAGAGRALGDAFADAVRSRVGAARAAGQALARAAAEGTKNAGSPTEHLFFDEAVVWSDALAAGLARGGRDVVAEATRIARAAAGTGIGGTGFGSSAGTGAGLSVGKIEVVVQGVSDPGTAYAAGQAAASGLVDGLTRRRITVEAGT